MSTVYIETSSHPLSPQMCFKEALFPLLARMRHGLYYNTYLVPGCRGSGLMQAFSKHLLARLGIHQEPSDPGRVRITLLSRSTKHRRIVNEGEVSRGVHGVRGVSMRGRWVGVSMGGGGCL